MLSALRADITRALRRLLATPTLLGVACLVLAIGVAANMLVYNTARNVLLRPFPSITDGSGLLQQSRPISYPVYAELARRAAGSVAISGIAAFRHIEVGLSLPSGDSARVAQAVLVTPNYFDVVGIRLSHGRVFTEAEATPPNRRASVILSHAAWKRYFQAGPDAIGQFVRLNGVVSEVVGVAPPDFAGTSFAPQADVFVPLTMWAVLAPQLEPLRVFSNPTMLAFTPLIRVSGDSGTAQAVAEANAILSTLPMRPPTGEILDFASVNELALPSEGRRAVVDLLRMLGAAAFTLLLLACVTVGHLLLTRGQSRRQEFAIRLALGATRRQLVREPLLEVCVLGCLAGLVAIGIFALMSSALDSLPLMVELSLRPSARVDPFSAALALAFTVLTVAICGIGPAMQAARRDAAEIVARGAGAMELATAKPVWLQTIVVAQVAICVLVVASSSVLIATARNDSHAHLGFDPTNVMVARARFSLVSYSNPNNSSRTAIS
ncbi:hypothetical protein BH23ACI1_BH23ACI1_32750 [soil metagenome]